MNKKLKQKLLLASFTCEEGLAHMGSYSEWYYCSWASIHPTVRDQVVTRNASHTWDPILSGIIVHELQYTQQCGTRLWWGRPRTHGILFWVVLLFMSFNTPNSAGPGCDEECLAHMGSYSEWYYCSWASIHPTVRDQVVMRNASHTWDPILSSIIVHELQYTQQCGTRLWWGMPRTHGILFWVVLLFMSFNTPNSAGPGCDEECLPHMGSYSEWYYCSWASIRPTVRDQVVTRNVSHTWDPILSGIIVHELQYTQQCRTRLWWGMPRTHGILFWVVLLFMSFNTPNSAGPGCDEEGLAHMGSYSEWYYCSWASIHPTVQDQVVTRKASHTWDPILSGIIVHELQYTQQCETRLWRGRPRTHGILFWVVLLFMSFNTPNSAGPGCDEECLAHMGSCSEWYYCSWASIHPTVRDQVVTRNASHTWGPILSGIIVHELQSTQQCGTRLWWGRPPTHGILFWVVLLFMSFNPPNSAGPGCDEEGLANMY